MATRRKPKPLTAAEKRRKAARAAELRAERKRAQEALRRKHARAAKRGWETRRKAKAAKPKVRKKVTVLRKQVKGAKRKPTTRRASKKPTRKTRHHAAQTQTLRQIKEEWRATALRYLNKFGLFNRVKAKKVIKKLTVEELEKFLENTTKRNWKYQAGAEENEYLDEDGDKHNHFWYH